jgi:UDP-N-acetyl-D-mannosaminuronic acid dehydrogenase
MNKPKQKICVLGLGYIGLPTALLMAKAGYEVVGVDVDVSKLEQLKQGQLYFEENGMEELFAEVSNSGAYSISFSNFPVAADMFVVAVPTPTKKGTADLSYVFSALESIKGLFKPETAIVLESTVGPSDCTKSIVPFLNEKGFEGVFALCTERAIPGNTIEEMIHNDRVIGLLDENHKEIIAPIYESFVLGGIFITDVNTAATAKLMENTYRSVNIALANELLKMSEETGVNIWEAISLANRHPRVNVHSPGPGVGGHCIPVDPYFLVKEDHTESLILKALEINESMPRFVAEHVKRLVDSEQITEPKVGVFGYAYKKNVDDCRETPSEPLVRILSEDFGYEVLVSDPFVEREGFVETNSALTSINIAVFVVDHDAYLDIDFSQYPSINVVVDTKNMFEKNADARIKVLGK